MKYGFYLFGFAALIAGTQTSFAAEKVCFGSTKSSDTKGSVFKVKITKKEVTVKTVKVTSGIEYDGTYPSYNSEVEGRDGKTYLQYKGNNVDYQDVVMVDKELLKKSTTGLLQIRARGEGFFNYVYVCKDNDE